MATLRLTDQSARYAKAAHRQTDLRDSVVRGLVLRVYPQGRKTWGLLYRTEEGRRRWYKLGSYPDLSVKKARKLAEQVKGRIARGEDPQAEREAARRRGAVHTVADLADQYLRRYARRRKRPRSYLEDKGQIERYLLPAWGRLPVTEIARRDVKALLEEVADGKIAVRGLPTTSAPRQLRALLSKMFAWAVEEEILPGNPASGVPLPVKPQSRDRVLTEDEIRTLWAQLEQLDTNAPISAAALRMLLLTAQRPGEVLAMRWSDISGQWWTIPAERMKNGRNHRVPLSPEAQEVIASVRSLSGSEWVFESPSRPGRPVSTLKTAVHGILRRTDMVRWTPHDLRRTAATHMTSTGIPRLVVERILGHAEHGIAVVYDRSSYDQEKRRALTAWGRRVKRILIGDLPSAALTRIG